jgi:hypothetical protein
MLVFHGGEFLAPCPTPKLEDNPFWMESLKGRDHSQDLGIDGRKMLKWILGKYGLGVWIGFIWLKIGTGGGLL